MFCRDSISHLRHVFILLNFLIHLCWIDDRVSVSSVGWLEYWRLVLWLNLFAFCHFFSILNFFFFIDHWLFCSRFRIKLLRHIILEVNYINRFIRRWWTAKHFFTIGWTVIWSFLIHRLSLNFSTWVKLLNPYFVWRLIQIQLLLKFWFTCTIRINRILPLWTL